MARGTLALLLLVAAVPQASATQVSLVKTGGVYAVPVEINGAITLNFIVDSGAAEVNIPADVVMTLIRANTIAPSDFLPGRTYVLADGSRVQSPRFVIRSIRIGGHVIENVAATIGEVEGSLLLGQSILERLGRWSLDAGRGVMVFGEPGSGPEPAVPVSVAQGCDDWKSAPPTCAVGFVRQYYENLSRGNCDGAGAQWAVRGERRRMQCVKASSTFNVQRIAVTRADSSGVDVAVQTDELSKHRKGLLTSWSLGVRLAPGTPWSIVDLKGTKNASVAAAAPVAAPPAAGCGDWRSASPNCASGFVRAYYEDLSRGDCDAALAKWRNAPGKTGELCRRASSTFQLAEISTVQAEGGSANVAVRALEVDKQSAGVVACWQLNVRLTRGTPWAISVLSGRRCHAL
jgi:hypothetical protein